MSTNYSPLFRWILKNNISKEQLVYLKNISRDLNISLLVAKLLWDRGIRSKKDICLFLNPGLKYLQPLSSVKNLVEAANFVASILKEGKKIAIWGDYDVDGITSTAILVDFFRKKGFSPLYYIPDRFEEGYGLNIDGLEQLISKGVHCIITVDSGISNVDEVKWLKEKGVNIVITDHHLPGDDLPEADFIINPKIDSDAYYNLAGVGIAFLFMAALNNEFLPKLDIRQYLDLVALGTIADVVPIDLDNRILVKNGLLVLNETKRPGIIALKEVSGLNSGAKIGTYEVGYILAPRINACGRMAKGQLGVELLLSYNMERAKELAKELESYNSLRKKEEDRILNEALKECDNKGDAYGIVLYNEGWHEGIIGIVASRICEKTYRPTILLTGKNGVIKGSGRSIPEVDLYSVLKKCGQYLKKFGGHRQAAGLSLEPNMIECFENAFVETIKDIVRDKELTPQLIIDSNVSLEDIDYSLIKELEMLEPFGPGNPEPTFSTSELLVQKYKVVAQEHVFLELRDEKAKRTMWGKAWKMVDFIPNNIEGKYVKVAFYPKISTYNGLIGIDLMIKDLIIS